MSKRILGLTLMLVVVALVGTAVAQDEVKDRSQDIQRVGPPTYVPTQPSPFCSSPQAPIDSGLPNTVDVINIPDNFVITDLNVQVTITHTFLSDIEMFVTNGVNTVDLSWDDCGSNDDMNVTFDDAGPALTTLCATPTVGTAATTTNNGPQEFLSVFNGANINGNWTLDIHDDAGGDTGTLDQWCIITTPVPVELKGFDVE